MWRDERPLYDSARPGMKLVRCDGRTLEVYNVGDKPVLVLVAGAAPIKAHGWRMLSDDEARELVQAIQKAGACRSPS